MNIPSFIFFISVYLKTAVFQATGVLSGVCLRLYTLTFPVSLWLFCTHFQTQNTE